jgi:hypothetical protein
MLSPVKRAILDAVVPATARWLVALMRRMEEASMDSETRWELLRRRLEQLAGETR